MNRSKEIAGMNIDIFKIYNKIIDTSIKMSIIKHKEEMRKL